MKTFATSGEDKAKEERTLNKNWVFQHQRSFETLQGIVLLNKAFLQGMW